MVELKGSLEGIGLPAIVQLVTGLEHSGTLELTDAETTGLLGFDEGRLISAVVDELRGLAALRHITLGLSRASFRFVEGRASGERNLDLSGADVQRELARFAAGEEVGDTPRADVPDEPAPPETCPRLGLADDPTRNRTRPTALHRCYASIAPSTVTIDEQRELCLSGRYALCPRFRSASRPRRMPNGPTRAERSVPADASPLAPPDPAPRVSPDPAPRVTPDLVPRVTPDLVPRLTPDPAPRVTPDLAPRRPLVPTRPTLAAGVPLDPSGDPTRADAGNPSRPRPVMVATLAVGALAVLASGAYLLARTSPQAPPAAGPTPAVQAFEPVPTRPAVASASALPSAAPSATVSVAGVSATLGTPPPATPSVPVSASPAGTAATGRTLLDVRFTTGAPTEWTQNPPFVQWSDGAYRLRALQAARFVAVGAPLLNPPSDVLVSTTFRKTGGPPGGGYGIVLRQSTPVMLEGTNQIFSGYVLETNDMGEFGIWRRDGDRWSDLVPWTRSAVVRVGGSPNDLTARIQGQVLAFTVNGLEVANVRDSTLRGGSVGLFVGGDFNEVALDHCAVQALTP